MLNILKVLPHIGSVILNTYFKSESIFVISDPKNPYIPIFSEKIGIVWKFHFEFYIRHFFILNFLSVISNS